MPRPPAPKILVCVVCDKSFERTASDIKNASYRSTCSHECRYKSVSKTLMGHEVSEKTRNAVAQSNRIKPRHTKQHTPETRQRMRDRMALAYAPIKAYFGVVAKRGQLTFTKWQRKRLIADRCIRCGSAEWLELDHITPWFAGGTQDDCNAQTLCKACNNRKHREDLAFYSHLVATRVSV